MSCRRSPYALLLGAAALAQARLIEAPIYDFLSRPDVLAPRIFVDAYNASEVAPGYLFLSPFSPEVGRNPDDSVNYNYGPMIYDNAGVRPYTRADLGDRH
jgi:hypothetical protein